MTVSAHRRPLRIEGATLIVRDLARVARFYRDVLGLAEHAAEPGRARLGAPEAAFLTLVENRAAETQDPRGRGLFHIAYLFADRRDLGAWLRHAAAVGQGLDGASDHGVSEALYLQDPEGNGIELYADRPDEDWPRTADGAVSMTTARLDLERLMAEADAWRGAPAETRIGHVHLMVDDLETAERRYRERLALDRITGRSGAVFLGAGGYHHHIAANIWRSAGAPERPTASAGLDEIRFSADAATFERIREAASEPASAEEATMEDPSARRLVVAKRPAAP